MDIEKTKETFNSWLEKSPKAVKAVATKYPPFKSWKMKKDAPYTISCPGTKVLIIGYTEDAKVMVVVTAKSKLPEAVKAEKELCKLHKTDYDKVKDANVEVEVEAEWLEEIHGEEPDYSEIMSEHAHEDGVQCDACRDGIESVKEQQEKMMAKHGWVIHFVMEDPLYPFGINIHTHGLQEKYSHPDLQVCFPIDPDMIQGLIWDVVEQIEAGEKFEAGKDYDKIIKNLPVKFINAIDGDHTVLRMVLPDSQGKFDSEPYSKQIPVVN